MFPASRLAAAAQIPLDRASVYAPHLSEGFDAWGINTPERMAAFIAQVGHESAGFKAMSENLSYRADRIRDLGRQNGPGSRWAEAAKQADKLARNQSGLANFVYADRLGNGDEAGGDGWRFRGRGLKQLTGRANYRDIGRIVKASFPDAPSFESDPDCLMIPRWAAISACAFWHAKGCNQFADAGDFRGLTKRINGGLIGLADREARHRIAKKALGA